MISPLYGTLSVWIADRVHFLFLTLDLSQLGWLLLTEKTSKLIKTLNLQLSLADDDDILSFVCLGLKNVAVGVSETIFHEKPEYFFFIALNISNIPKYLKKWELVTDFQSGYFEPNISGEKL